jgi:hypothetical protein
VTHYLLRDGAPVYDEHGKSQHLTSRFYVGRAKCTCGALSPKGISRAAAGAWMVDHRKAAS